MEIAIIGLGSWGLSFLERIVTGSRSQWGPVRVHIVEPGMPGSGVYAVDQPDYLILNTPCGLSLIHISTRSEMARAVSRVRSRGEA